MMKFILGAIILCVMILPVVNFFIKWNNLLLNEKATAFECGFDPLSKSRNPISMRFFVLIVLFLIFDVEIMLLFPVLMKFINLSYSLMVLINYMLFIAILFLGLAYEWKDGSLEWIK